MLFKKFLRQPIFSTFLCLLPAGIIGTTTYTVTTGSDTVATGGNPGELRFILNSILNDQAQGISDTRIIQFAPSVNTVSLNAIPPMINLFSPDTVSVNMGGSGVAIDGNGFRPFYIVQGNVTLENLQIQNAMAVAGTGGGGDAGGGGGMGAGGAIFVDSANVVLNGVDFVANNAMGGSGGLGTTLIGGGGGGGGLGGIGGIGIIGGGGGGGGYSGNGGNSVGASLLVQAGGGGGSFGNGGNSDPVNNSGGGGGGAIIGVNGGTGSGSPGTSIAGFVFGGGGAGGDGVNGGNGGGTGGGAGGVLGGGGGGGFNGSDGEDGSSGGGGGAGGMGGGGGGADATAIDFGGGPGGIGGGGGGGAPGSSNNAPGGYGGGGGGSGGIFGTGGFGGGGGYGGDGGFGGGGSAKGAGGFGGGGGAQNIGGVGGGLALDSSSGGGGAGFGGAVFLNTGSIEFQGDSFTNGNGTIPGSGGDMNASGGFAAGSDIFLVSGANLTFNPASSQTITLAGSIADDSSTSVPGGPMITPGTGSGASISKQGAGTLVMQGNSTYIGGTSLLGGILTVNGSIILALNTVPGTILKGTGSVGDVVLGGTVSPGNSTATITMNSINFLSGSIFAVEIDPTTSSKIDVIGNATISGPTTIVVTEDPGVYTNGKRYTILDAGSISGTNFLSATSTDPNFIFKISTSIPNQIDLILMLKGINLSSLTGNRLSIANYLNSLEGTILDGVIDQLSLLSDSELHNALDSISPARNSHAIFASQNIAFAFTDIVSSRLANRRFIRLAQDQCLFCAQSECTPQVGWISGFGDFSYEKQDSQTPGFQVNSGGVVLGYDLALSENFLVGASFGYGQIDIQDGRNFGKQNVDDYLISLYSSIFYDQFFLDGIVWGSYQDISRDRNIFFPGFEAIAKSDTTSYQIIPHLAAGYDFISVFGIIEPFIEADCAVNFERAFKEKGAFPLNMEQRSRTSTLLRSQAGFAFMQFLNVHCDGLLTFREKISYVNKMPFNVGRIKASIVGEERLFTVDSLKSDYNLVAAGLEIFYTNPSGFFTSLNCNGEYGSRFWSTNAYIKVGKSF